MRQKELELVITFHTTASAMKMEKVCKMASIPGRLIPVPQQISAGCGLAWCVQKEYREEMLQIIKANDIQMEQLHQFEGTTPKIGAEKPEKA